MKYFTGLVSIIHKRILKEGLLADIIAVKGNPLEEISVMEDIPFVMKDGVVYKQQ